MGIDRSDGSKFKIYDDWAFGSGIEMFTINHSTNNIGIKLTNKIENYKTEYGNYPNEIKTLKEKLNLNLIEKYIADKIVYKKLENEYILELKFLNHNLKEFDNELKEWN